MRDILSVKKNYLTLIAGLVWVLAGSMVISLGLPPFLKLTPRNNWIPFLAIIVFLLFYLLIFSKLEKKHVARIRSIPAEKMPFWCFFDLPSYMIMAVMMSGGIILRVQHLIPELVIAFFYSGLGLALFSCGTRFLNAFSHKKVVQ